MSQDFTDDCFASGHVAQTDMQNIENNFAALKSCFSGSSAPPDTVAGMWWYDTSADILKLRNEANSAWLNVFDFSIGASYGAKGIAVSSGAGLSGGGELITNQTISHAPHTGDVTGSASLTIATGAVTATKLDNEAVITNKIKTGTGNLDGSINDGAYAAIQMQDYCFFPNIHTTDDDVHVSGYVSDQANYVGRFILKNSSGSSQTYDVDYRYITSSDEPFIFLLQDKATGKFTHTWICDDPPPGFWGLDKTPEDFVAPIILSDSGGLREIILWKQSPEFMKEIRNKRHKDRERLLNIFGEYEYDRDKKMLVTKNLRVI